MASWKTSLAAVKSTNADSEPPAKAKKKKGTKKYQDEEEEPAYNESIEDEAFQDEGLEDRPKTKKKKKKKKSKAVKKYRLRDDGPSCWADVDAEIEGEAEELFSNITTSINSGSIKKQTILEQLFAASKAAEREVKDPLGRGVLDFAKLSIVEPGTATRLSKVISGRARSSTRGGAPGDEDRHSPRGTASAGGGGAQQQQQQVAAQHGIPADVAQHLPDHESFSPDAFLAAFHKDTSFSGLKKGMRVLGGELEERSSQLKQLIRENFDRFTSCQSTIDDIYGKLQQLEGMGLSASDQQRQANNRQAVTSGPEGVQRAIESLQASARETWGGVLSHAQQCDRIRRVQGLLQRFSSLFGMPARIKSLASEGILDQIVSEYKRANALIRPHGVSQGGGHSKVWSTLHAEIEKRVLEAYQTSRHAVMSPTTDMAAIPEHLCFMAQLTSEALSGVSQEEQDVMRWYLAACQGQLDQALVVCDSRLHVRLNTLRSQLKGHPSTFAAATAFASAWKLQGPIAWQLESLQRTSTVPEDEVPDTPRKAASSGSRDNALGQRDLHGALPRQKSRAARAAPAGRNEEDSDDSVSEPPDAVDSDDVSDQEDNTDSDDVSLVSNSDNDVARNSSNKQTATQAGAPASRAPTTSQQQADVLQRTSVASSVPGMGALPDGPPALPSSIEDLALLMWPGTSDWDPGTHLPPAMQSDLNWRLSAGTPRSALLPEPTFRLAPAQSAWAEYIAALCTAIQDSLPRLWGVVKSDKYEKAAELSAAARDSLVRGPSLARKMIDSVMTSWGSRVQVALQALSQAGPLCPATELMVKELARTWRSLQQQQSVPSKALDAVHSAAISALGLYAACLRTHLVAAPTMILDSETWELDRSCLHQQPITSMPNMLQDEFALVMFHFGVLSSACQGMDPDSLQKSWQPIREGMQACLESLATLLDTYSGQIKVRIEAAAKLAEISTSAQQLQAGQGSWDAAAKQLSLAPQDDAAVMVDVNGDTNSLATPSGGITDLHISASGRVVAKSATTAATSPATGDSATGQALPAALAFSNSDVSTGISEQDERHVLLLISNCIWVKDVIVPTVAATYGTGLGITGSVNKSFIAAQLSKLQKSTQVLLAVFTRHRASQAERKVAAYISISMSITAEARASVVNGIPGARQRSFVQAKPAAIAALPASVSQACMALLSFLTASYNLLFMHCSRGVLDQVLAALLEVICGEISSRVADLTPEAAGVTSQLSMLADITFLNTACHSMLNDDAQGLLSSSSKRLMSLLKQAFAAKACTLTDSNAGSTTTGGLGQMQKDAAAQLSRSVTYGSSSRDIGRDLAAWAAAFADATLEKCECQLACFRQAVA